MNKKRIKENDITISKTIISISILVLIIFQIISKASKYVIIATAIINTISIIKIICEIIQKKGRKENGKFKLEGIKGKKFDIIIFAIVIVFAVFFSIKYNQKHKFEYTTILIPLELIYIYVLNRIFFNKKNHVPERIINAIITRIFSIILLNTNNIVKVIDKITKKEVKTSNIMFLIGKISNGGAERACVNLAEALSKYYNVIIVTYDNKENKEKRYNCCVETIDIADDSKYSLLARIKAILKIKKERNIKYTISFLNGANYLNVVTSRHDYSIISIRNFLSDSQNKKKMDIYKNKIACKYSDKIITVSKSVQYDLENSLKINKKNVQTISNFIDFKKIENSLKTDKIDLEEQEIFFNSDVVITVGRLINQKGQWNLIRAFKKVVKNKPNAKLIILGDGELKEYFEDIINKNNLTNNVYIMGFKKNPYIYMKKSKIFVLTSYYEGMPNVLLEAMACELPIIATDSNGGNREILTDGVKTNQNIKNIEYGTYGILVPVCKKDKMVDEELSIQEEYIAEAILKLLNDKKIMEKYKEASKNRIKEFKKENIIKKWQDILN